MNIYTSVSQQLAPYIEHKQLVLGFSGGVDSRVLLHLLIRLRQQHPNIDIKAVHIDHGLSPNSPSWLLQCKQWCADENIAFAHRTVIIERKPRTSIEQQAREIRYQILAEFMTPNAVLLTAQHQDDQLETFLLALKRGSGPKGLSAMPKAGRFNDTLHLRPLLNIQRDQIEQYAIDNRIDWVEDETNQNTKYERNFIRHQVAPVLKSRWPNITHMVNRSAHLCAEQEQLLEELLTPVYQQCVQDHVLGIEQLLDQTPRAQNWLIRHWFESQGVRLPTQKQLQAIINECVLAREDASPIVTVNQHQVRRFKQRLYLISPPSNLEKWQQRLEFNQWLTLPDGKGKIGIFQQGSTPTYEQDWVADIDIDVATPVDLGFQWQGKSAHPVGRGHSRTLKKLWQEYQLPIWQRGQLPILSIDSHIVCVMGLFVDKQFSGNSFNVIWRRP